MIFLTLDCSRKGDLRFHPSVVRVTIAGKEDTIDNIFNGALRDKLGNPCGYEEADHFFLGGTDFPVELCEEFYLSLWLQRIKVDKFMQKELNKYDKFFDGRGESVYSHARAFRCYRQGGIPFLKGRCSRFLSAYGKMKKKAGEEDNRINEPVVLPVRISLPTWQNICTTALAEANVVFDKDGGRESCYSVSLKDFGFSNLSKITMYDTEKLQHIISEIVLAYYDKKCGDVTDGYVKQKVLEGKDEYEVILKHYV